MLMRATAAVLVAFVGFAPGSVALPPSARNPVLVLAAGPASPPKSPDALSPEEKMQRRYPQPVRVGDLIGLPVLDDQDRTLGRVKSVVRTAGGKSTADRALRRFPGLAAAAGRGADRGRRHRRSAAGGARHDTCGVRRRVRRGTTRKASQFQRAKPSASASTGAERSSNVDPETRSVAGRKTPRPMTGVRANDRGSRPLHPLALRVMHWINAIAMIIMIMSGWAIYNDEVIFGWLHFPGLDDDGRRTRGRPAVALPGDVDPDWPTASPISPTACAPGRFRRMLLPIRIVEIITEIRSALALKLSHDDLTRYNAVQRLLYIGIIVVIVLQVLSGLVIWKPVQFSELAYLFYSFQGARLMHFLGMVAIVGFLLVHVALALIVPKTLIAMLTGGPRAPRARAGPSASRRCSHPAELAP